ncbi:hypothetical protein [Pseudohongiella spirulinae]|uniref:Lipoprotein, putative n=1 Tax=Pseudohongiella spirulinae TaxID=1249552 RepID=A0A0S2KGV8_9GAMM|nr:hypothetical protein [Pseudohongiella spirulinae]ALO47575.1 Lipoprotein, putative [Pseudohongiella spirulinae]
MQALKPIFALTAMLLLGLSGCATTSVKSTEFVPVVQGTLPMDEDLILDVGVKVFDPGIDEVERRDLERTNFEIRRAESRYAPYLMADTLQRSGNWGVVRVIPTERSVMDVYVHGQILLSNGEGMILDITVTDATGRQWFSKEYEEHISQYNYDPSQRQSHDPFQVIYNTIANDMLAYRQQNISNDDMRNIRTVAELKFAAEFAPEIYADYLQTDNRGITSAVRLPADNDPTMARIRDIRERDYLFVDTIQDYYATYVREMRGPYDAWREVSFRETLQLEEAERSARRRFVAGAAAIAGGIAAVGQNNAAAQTAGIVGVGAGAYLVRSGFDRSAEASMHIAALQEIGESLQAEVAPKVIELEDRTIMLSGTVEEQYEQWQDILMEIYLTETGGL